MRFTHGHALVIGVGLYAERPLNAVRETTVDAQLIADLLRDPCYCGYPEGQVILLSNTTATRSGILGALDELATTTNFDDTIVVFFAGHGNMQPGGNYYLPVYDTHYVGDVATSDSVINDHELLAKLRAIEAGRMLLVFNTCHAGAFSPTLADDTPVIGQPLALHTAAALLGTGEGRIIITACREQQYAYIGPGPGTIFGRALGSALRGERVRNENGVVSAYELYVALYHQVAALVRAEVPAQLRHQYCETQEPQLTILKGIGSFAVALYRGAATIGEIDRSAHPPASTAVRELSRELSQQAYHQTIARGIDFGRENTVDVQGNVVGGDQHTATLHGDYTTGNIDKREGVFIDGGSTVSKSTIVGVNQGTITIGGPRDTTT